MKSNKSTKGRPFYGFGALGPLAVGWTFLLAGWLADDPLQALFALNVALVCFVICLHARLRGQ